MAQTGSRANGSRVSIAGAGIAVMWGVLMAGPATAQQQKSQPKQAPPAQQQPAAAAQPQSMWVKLCDKQILNRAGADGKPVKEERTICSTQHEQPEPDLQGVRLSISLLQMAGDNRTQLNFRVPMGMFLPEGLSFAIVSAQETEGIITSLRSGKPYDDSKTNYATLPFVTCHPGGCVVEIEPSPELIKNLQAGGGVLVRTKDVFGRNVQSVAPLQGFTQTLAGPSQFDSQQYGELRQKILREQMQSRIQEQRQAGHLRQSRARHHAEGD